MPSLSKSCSQHLLNQFLNVCMSERLIRAADARVCNYQWLAGGGHTYPCRSMGLPGEVDPGPENGP